MRLAIFALIGLLIATFAALPGHAQSWVASWTGSAQGPYPTGNATAQPELKFALPSVESGADDQTFRLIIRPDVWGPRARIRLSNAFGKRPVTFDGVFVGLRGSGAMLVPSTNRNVTFGGRTSVTIEAAGAALSDPVALPWTRVAPWLLADRALAISFHVAGQSGPMTWHAKALTTSYLSGPRSGAHGGEESEAAFPFSTTSWYFLDELDMAVNGARTVVAFGDSITDGTASTLNGDDRWPDVFSRRVHAALGDRYSVVNEGIGGNRVIGPSDYATAPFSGGPSALDRLQRDVISLPNVSTIVWLEGINDFGSGGADVDAVAGAVREAIKRLRAAIPHVKIFMATLTSSLHSTNSAYGGEAVDEKRHAYNTFIRTAGIFDGVIDFDAATLDAATGELKAEFQPNSTTGAPGDKLHPNRAGYASMGRAIDLGMVFGGAPTKP
jgi:lysophospholipase L1-like esterase